MQEKNSERNISTILGGEYMTVCMCCTSNWYYYLLINIFNLNK